MRRTDDFGLDGRFKMETNGLKHLYVEGLKGVQRGKSTSESPSEDGQGCNFCGLARGL